MKAKMDKLKKRLNLNKKTLIFLFGLLAVGFIFGTIFITMLQKSDKELVKEYMQNYVTNINLNKLNYKNALINSLITNIGFVLSVWLLGISVIGAPVVLFMYFTKSFVLGFSISSFILKYKIKGCLYSLLYLFPNQILLLITYTFLTLYSISFSIKIIYSIFYKKQIDFKIMTNKYTKVLIFSIIIGVLSSLYEVFIIPNILKTFI